LKKLFALLALLTCLLAALASPAKADMDPYHFFVYSPFTNVWEPVHTPSNPFDPTGDEMHSDSVNPIAFVVGPVHDDYDTVDGHPGLLLEMNLRYSDGFYPDAEGSGDKFFPDHIVLAEVQAEWQVRDPDYTNSPENGWDFIQSGYAQTTDVVLQYGSWGGLPSDPGYEQGSILKYRAHLGCGHTQTPWGVEIHLNDSNNYEMRGRFKLVFWTYALNPDGSINYVTLPGVVEHETPWQYDSFFYHDAVNFSGTVNW
jgi:hypothetical protein